MLTVTILCSGNLKESYLREACAEYHKRLSAYCIPKVVELKDGTPLAPYLPKKAYKIALCVEGKEVSSQQLSQILSDIPVRGYSEVCFIIGAFDGIPEEIKKACDLRLSISPMTFPHQMMRVILAEQFYRAHKINANESYHK